MSEQLAQLKAQADALGINYSPNISAATLSQRIQDYTSKQETVSSSSEDTSRSAVIAEASKLIRCQITPMDKAKSNYDGEVFTVGNAVVPTMKKFVQFGVPTHVPKMILDFIKEKQMLIFYTERLGGKDVRKAREGAAYGVVELPPLTEKELKELAAAQAARNSI